MNYTHNIIVISALLSGLSSCNRMDYYSFKPRDENFTEKKHVTTYDQRQSRIIEITTLNDSTQIYHSIFCKNPYDYCSFHCVKHKNGNWSLFVKDSLVTFFNNQKKEINGLTLVKDSILLIPDPIRELPLEELYSFQLQKINFFSSAPQIAYIFSPKHGIIGIISPKTNLIRTDFR